MQFVPHQIRFTATSNWLRLRWWWHPKQAIHYQNSLRNKFSSRFQLLRELVYKWTNFVLPTEGKGQQIHVLMLTANEWTRHKHEITDSNFGKYDASSNLICTLIFAGYPHATSSHFVLLCSVHTLHNSKAIKIMQNLDRSVKNTLTPHPAHTKQINKIRHSTAHVIIL